MEEFKLEPTVATGEQFVLAAATGNFRSIGTQIDMNGEGTSKCGSTRIHARHHNKRYDPDPLECNQ
jgi:hypothetical protein